MNAQPENPNEEAVSMSAIQSGSMHVIDLPVGTRIAGFEDYNDAFQLEWRIRDELMGAIFPQREGDWRPDYRNHKFINSYIAEQLRKKRFNGRIEDVSAIVIPPDIRVIPTSRPANLDHVFSFVTTLELSSTGRGRIGSFVAETTLYYSPKPTFPGTRSVFRQLTGTEGADALNYLLRASNDGWREGKWDAMLKTISAGLPTLGKRR